MTRPPTPPTKRQIKAAMAFYSGAPMPRKAAPTSAAQAQGASLEAIQTKPAPAVPGKS